MEFLGLAQTSQFALYFVFVFGIIVLPGMDMAYVMASALAGGRASGLAAVAGVVAGGMVHTLMAFLGFGLLVENFPAAFNAMLLAGAAYLAWIGWSLMSGASALGEVSAAPAVPLTTSFRRGALSCLLNPKAYLFMLAVFPQFMRPHYGSMVVQAVILGAITAFTQMAVYGAIALGASGLRDWLGANAKAQIRLGQGVGFALMLAALWTAYESWA